MRVSDKLVELAASSPDPSFVLLAELAADLADERAARRRLYDATMAYATRYGRSNAERDDLNKALTAAAALDAPEKSDGKSKRRETGVDGDEPRSV